MQTLDAYPQRSVGGSCFVTKRYELTEDERVVSLDIDLANLPTHGLLVVSEEAVRQMNVCLGWDTDVHGAERLAETRAQVAELEDANAKLQAALEMVVSVQAITYAPVDDFAVDAISHLAKTVPVPVKKATIKKAAAKKIAAKKAAVKK